ncbi:hypothetical protein [Salarchaeum sp. JOR-1]|uniref:hypothetical protein n=1 Tax=Salarchaeum sp. JOR-1 TaxID=2599399 RepID=UPI0011986050|nr:hypothetical protein [Salarchaeum sp. JOR-1]QDX40187.1 hypothetical protein FQU85_04490 [Salarchaeum sp. JOR-1]
MPAALSEVLFDGESVVERVDCGANALVVTTHRVVALTPTGEGERVRYADRPNVETVRAETAGTTRHLRFGLRQTAFAVFLFAAGTLFSLDRIADSVTGATGTASELGIGSLVRVLAAVALFARYFDDALVGLSGLTALLAALGFARYLRSRSRSLVVETYGGDELRVPAPDADESDVGRILEALD